MKASKIIFFLGLFILLFVIVIAFRNQEKEENILELNLVEHKNLALHIHPELEIEILGVKQTIFANTGISGTGLMRVIHTHDDSGKLHIESPYPHQFYLADFFALLEKPFNSTCIFSYCIDENHTVTMSVNGNPSTLYENLPLKDADKIKIVYAEKK